VIAYGRHCIGEEEKQAVLDVLESDFLTQGQQVPLFEKELAQSVGAVDAVAVANGSVALHLACAALGLKRGDWYWTTPITFAATANCAKICGAKVDFVDIDPLTRNICPLKLEQKLLWAEKNQRLPKAIGIVHFAGLSADLNAIAELADRYDIAIVEDAAHAVGGVSRGEAIGSSKRSRFCAFSFHPVKNMTSGEGGALCFSDLEQGTFLRALRENGIVRGQSQLLLDEPGAWRYEQHYIGFNYRMTDIQAALGRVQLKKLKQFVEQRRDLVSRYDEAFRYMPIKTVSEPDGDCTAWHLYVIELDKASLRDDLFNKLRQHGFAVNVHYYPLHLQPYYRKLGYKRGDFPNSEAYYDTALTLPLFPGLERAEQARVIKIIEEVTS
jgi:UDP-4-amino-4,6-dideoxy-N-acetyl-beta-L-altrosamine transaminase